jgi:hypothetical protein
MQVEAALSISSGMGLTMYSPVKARCIRTCQERTMSTLHPPAKDPEKVPDQSIEGPDYIEPIEDPERGEVPEDEPDDDDDEEEGIVEDEP